MNIDVVEDDKCGEGTKCNVLLDNIHHSKFQLELDLLRSEIDLR